MQKNTIRSFLSFINYGYQYIFFGLFAFILCTSCKTNTKNTIEEDPYWLTQYSFFDKDQYYNYFKTHIISANTDYLWLTQLKVTILGEIHYPIGQ